MEDARSLRVAYRPGRLVQALARTGMTQVGVAYHLGVSLRTVQNWCAPGGPTPGGDNLVALARLMDCSPDWFFDDDEGEAA